MGRTGILIRWTIRPGAGSTARITTPRTPARRTATTTWKELVGGPLDGLLLDVTGWAPGEKASGAALITETGLYGPGGRACYGPRAANPDV